MIIITTPKPSVGKKREDAFYVIGLALQSISQVELLVALIRDEFIFL